jgi:serine/threonine-protein kinase
VRNREYLAFLNDLVERGEVDAPALKGYEGRTTGEAARAWGLARKPDGRYGLVDEHDTHLLDLPVVEVDWHAACHYARWLSARTGEVWRLPHEFEWEKAARGVDGRILPWGSFFEPTWAQVAGAQAGPSRRPVGSYPLDQSVYGVMDICGGVREWQQNAWETGRLGAPERLDPAKSGDAESRLRVGRGGAWNTIPVNCRPAMRLAAEAALRYVGAGFRLSRRRPFPPSLV